MRMNQARIERGLTRSATAGCAVLLLVLAQTVSAEVVRVDIQRTDDAGTHERVIGRVYFAIDPKAAANRAIADVDRAPTNANGMVEFSGDLLFFRPKAFTRARGATFLEVVNRGRDQSLLLMSGVRQPSGAPETWSVGDGFLLQQGFAVAFLGWQFDVTSADGLALQVPVAPVDGPVRRTYIEDDATARGVDIRLSPYCASASGRDDARLTFRTRLEAPQQVVPRDDWQFSADGCAVSLVTRAGAGLYEVTFESKGSPLAGLGLAAIRDFAAYLKHGTADAPLRENPAALQRVVGYGYSQSARLLREFVRDGFNADEQGRQAFDALMIASAGAGGGSFNHRFAMPGAAGNSVLSILRPTDLPPFTDDGLLAKSRADKVTPKIFYTASSTEYWARFVSLTCTSEDGRRDVPFAPSSRFYFIAGTPHAIGPLPPVRSVRDQTFRYAVSFAQQRWVQRALLLALDDWASNASEPPPSKYPTIANGELVTLPEVKFPAVPSLPFAGYMPQTWQMSFGPRFTSERIITVEPPELGAPYVARLPQVDADGNDLGGIRIPEVAVPLGTYTGWNIGLPQRQSLGYLGGLFGTFERFALTSGERQESGDARLSIADRYRDRDEYLSKVDASAQDLVRQRFLLVDDLFAVRARAAQMWDAVVGSVAPN
jgi:Alpha/beta hydrolase domain